MPGYAYLSHRPEQVTRYILILLPGEAVAVFLRCSLALQEGAWVHAVALQRGHSAKQGSNGKQRQVLSGLRAGRRAEKEKRPSNIATKKGTLSI